MPSIGRMRTRISKILVTGGAGFIGSVFVRLAIAKGHKVIVCDKLTYAGDKKRLGDVWGRFRFYKADICDKEAIGGIFKKEKPDIVINFAAETHVDRSILDPTAFLKTNFLGTQVLLDASRKFNIRKFIHISTDEVYGDIKSGSFYEDSPLKPNSPYAVSKAAADMLIRSYVRTYDFPAIIVRPCNNYGPWQYPEKLIMLSISMVLRNKKIPLYANGKNIREWLFVDDCAQGILQIMEKGRPGDIYNLGSGEKKNNIQVAHLLLIYLKKDKSMIRFVKDRPGHDLRYSLNSYKVFKDLKWKPSTNFKSGIALTIQWCLRNKEWLFNRLKNVAPLYK